MKLRRVRPGGMPIVVRLSDNAAAHVVKRREISVFFGKKGRFCHKAFILTGEQSIYCNQEVSHGWRDLSGTGDPEFF